MNNRINEKVMQYAQPVCDSESRARGWWCWGGRRAWPQPEDSDKKI